MKNKKLSNQRETTVENRVSSDLWKRIKKAEKLGESILQAQEHRGVGQILTPDQLRTLASVTGVIDTYAPLPSLNKTAFFPLGNLPEETLHSISDEWRDEPIIFARTIPSAYVHMPRLEQLGITEAPDYYQRTGS